MLIVWLHDYDISFDILLHGIDVSIETAAHVGCMKCLKVTVFRLAYTRGCVSLSSRAKADYGKSNVRTSFESCKDQCD